MFSAVSDKMFLLVTVCTIWKKGEIGDSSVSVTRCAKLSGQRSRVVKWVSCLHARSAHLCL